MIRNLHAANDRFFRGIGTNILILGVVSLCTDVSSQMVFPLIPLYLTSVLAVGAYVVGLVEGAAETTASFLKVISGHVSDRIRRRKPFILLGYGLSSVVKPLFAFATVWPAVLGLRVIERVGKGLRTAPRDAIVAESCDATVRGRAFGFNRAMDGIGSMGGAVLAFLLLPVIGFRNVFLVAFIPGIIAVLAIFLIREEPSAAEPSAATPSLQVSLRQLPHGLRLFIAASAVFAFGHFGYAFLLLKALSTGASDTTALLFYVLFYGVYTVCTIPAGVVSDRAGRKPVIMSGYVLFGLLSAGLAMVAGSAFLPVFFALYGIFFALVDGAQRAFIVDMAPPALKATALGTFHTAIGLVALPGGFIAGLLWDLYAPAYTFLFGGIMAALALGLMAGVEATPASPAAA
ncbi:MAG: MFS transporter [Methanomicrobiales archaeon]|nr:MFS transporter [Methanomicrobiales archaeon]